MIARTINKKIEEAIKAFPVTVISGARQIGKSTEVFKFVSSHHFKYISLDNIDERRLAINDPKYFLELHGYPLIIDEVQYAPVLMEVIEEIVNKKRLNQENSNGMFILTGSQSFRLMQNVTQSMAGRAAVLYMEPLSMNEILGKEEIPFIPQMEMFQKQVQPLSISSLFEQIIKGFYPEIYSNENLDSNMFYARYITTYLERDINELINVKNKNKFHDFMQVLASLTGQQLNVNQLAKVTGVSSPTIREWLSVLETSGIIYFLQSYHDMSVIKRVVKSPKIYFADTGLAAYLAKINDAKTLEASVFAGSFMETYVMNEIRKSYLNNGLQFSGMYYRDTNQNEIDLILLHDATLHLVEIKKGISFNLRSVKSFKQLENSKYNKGLSCILCNTQDNYGLSERVLVLSISCI